MQPPKAANESLAAEILSLPFLEKTSEGSQRHLGSADQRNLRG
jgi:hypothetical protein